MSEPQARGINFRSFVGAARRLLGDDIVQRLLPHLPPELASQLERGGFVTNAWYPLAHFRALHVAAQAATHRGPELARALARESTLDDFRGIYRVLVFVLSPEFLMRRTPGIWKRYYDVGVVTVEARAGHAEAHFREAHGFDHVLWQDVIGGCMGVLEACGGKDVTYTVTAGGADDDFMSVIARWR